MPPTTSLRRLVGRILDLARIESTRPARERINLAAFLEGTVERYRRLGHELTLDYGAGDRTIDMPPISSTRW